MRADDAGRYCMPLPPRRPVHRDDAGAGHPAAHARKVVLDVRSAVVDIDAPAAVQVASPDGRDAMRLLIISDTHLPARARDLPAELWDEVTVADVVIHAGDWVTAPLLDDSSARAKRVVGVYGNNDGAELREPTAGGRPGDPRRPAGRRDPRDRVEGRSRAAGRPGLPGHRSADLRSQPHSLGHRQSRRGCGC